MPTLMIVAIGCAHNVHMYMVVCLCSLLLTHHKALNELSIIMMLRVRENRCDCIGDKIGIDISLWDLHPHQ